MIDEHRIWVGLETEHDGIELRVVEQNVGGGVGGAPPHIVTKPPEQVNRSDAVTANNELVRVIGPHREARIQHKGIG